jgi:hypothetical protein
MRGNSPSPSPRPLPAVQDCGQGIATQPSPHQPFGFARASRHKHRSEGAGRARHYDLVRHSLIGSKRRFRGKQVRSNVRVLVGRARGCFCVRLVEDA